MFNDNNSIELEKSAEDSINKTYVDSNTKIGVVEHTVYETYEDSMNTEFAINRCHGVDYGDVDEKGRAVQLIIKSIY